MMLKRGNQRTHIFGCIRLAKFSCGFNLKIK